MSQCTVDVGEVAPAMKRGLEQTSDCGEEEEAPLSKRVRVKPDFLVELEEADPARRYHLGDHIYPLRECGIPAFVQYDHCHRESIDLNEACKLFAHIGVMYHPMPKYIEMCKKDKHCDMNVYWRECAAHGYHTIQGLPVKYMREATKGDAHKTLFWQSLVHGDVISFDDYRGTCTFVYHSGDDKLVQTTDEYGYDVPTSFSDIPRGYFSGYFSDEQLIGPLRYRDVDHVGHEENSQMFQYLKRLKDQGKIAMCPSTPYIGMQGLLEDKFYESATLYDQKVHWDHTPRKFFRKRLAYERDQRKHVALARKHRVYFWLLMICVRIPIEIVTIIVELVITDIAPYSYIAQFPYEEEDDDNNDDASSKES